MNQPPYDIFPNTRSSSRGDLYRSASAFSELSTGSNLKRRLADDTFSETNSKRRAERPFQLDTLAETGGWYVGLLRVRATLEAMSEQATQPTEFAASRQPSSTGRSAECDPRFDALKAIDSSLRVLHVRPGDEDIWKVQGPSSSLASLNATLSMLKGRHVSGTDEYGKLLEAQAIVTEVEVGVSKRIQAYKLEKDIWAATQDMNTNASFSAPSGQADWLRSQGQPHAESLQSNLTDFGSGYNPGSWSNIRLPPPTVPPGGNSMYPTPGTVFSQYHNSSLPAQPTRDLQAYHPNETGVSSAPRGTYAFGYPQANQAVQSVETKDEADSCTAQGDVSETAPQSSPKV